MSENKMLLNLHYYSMEMCTHISVVMPASHQLPNFSIKQSSPSASPSSLGKLSPGPEYCVTPYSSKGSSTNFTKSEEAITKLRKEITSLRERFANRQKDWAEVSITLYMPLVVGFSFFGPFWLTVQKLHDFSIIQILCEINSGYSGSAKSAIKHILRL